MKIIATKIPEQFTKPFGLGKIEFSNLGKLVLLAGANGAGKSRILDLIEQRIGGQPRHDEHTTIQKEIGAIKARLQKEIESCERIKNQQISESRDAQPIDSITNHTQKIEELNGRLQDYEQQLTHYDLTFAGNQRNSSLVRFVPKHVDLRDPKRINPMEMEQYAKRAENLGVAEFHSVALARIFDLHIQYRDATHQDRTRSSEECESSIKSYRDLDDIVFDLLGIRIGNNERGQPTLFGLTLGDETKLSDGQKILLQLAVAIHAQGGKLSKTILMLDEPENHLHPGAIIEVLELLQQKVSDGQIWVATHSVPILAHFANTPEASLWFVEKGSVSNAGKKQRVVLKGLLGNEERIQRQRDFLEEPEIQATNAFLEQCILPPGVISSNVNDPQTTQVLNAINDLRATSEKVRILDYGAGKGRILKNIVADADINQVCSAIDYVAFDECSTNQQECEANIAKLYGTADNRWFQKESELFSGHNKQSFHLVIMCNVLHEIDPRKWLNLFGASGSVTESLLDTGYLLLVEDQRMKIGEHAHEFGFIVLDTSSLKDLCNVTGDDSLMSCNDVRGDGRLKAHLIPKSYLKRISHDFILKALNSHSKQAKIEIERLRAITDATGGRQFAFWLSQYANAMMALESMQKKD